MLLEHLVRSILSAKRVLVVQPHPDDAELGVGGTVALLAKGGAYIAYVTITDGSAGSITPADPRAVRDTRRREQEEAAGILGVAELLWMDYPDAGLVYSLELRNRLISIIRRLKPEVVFAPDPWLPYEAHGDHRVSGLAAAEASALSAYPLVNPADAERGLEPWAPRYVAFYFTAYPNVYIDITPIYEKKLRAIECHRSQFSHRMDYIRRVLEERSRAWGKKAGSEYGEAFKVVSPRGLHVPPLFAPEVLQLHP